MSEFAVSEVFRLVNSQHQLVSSALFVSASSTHLNANHSHMQTSGSQTTENEDEELGKASQQPTVPQPLPCTGSGTIMDEEEALGKVCNVTRQGLMQIT